MNRKKTGNNQYLKELNQALVMDLIRENKAISKIRLSEITGLSPTAIGIITGELQKQGFIHEAGEGESKGGRRPRLLELKSGSCYSVGVDFDVDYMNLLLLDITGEIIGQKSCRVIKWESIDCVIEKMESMIESAIADYITSGQRLLGVGISIPGLVEYEKAKVLMAPNLGWQNVDIKPYIKKCKDVPLYIENEAMASAICENWMGSCRRIENFICINIKSGIGAGIFVNGKLYRGSGGTAGEIGHITVDENGPRCGCGNFGCLETMASAGYIEKKARKLARQGIAKKLASIEDIDNISIDDVVKAAREGDEAALDILKESGRYLGIAIAYAVNMLNPEKVVIGKEFIKYANIVLDTIKTVVECKALKAPASQLVIEASEIGDKASTVGAALLPLKILFGR